MSGRNFTPKKREKFLAALAETGVVTYACREVKISRRAAYDLREQDPEFAKSWDLALEIACDDLEQEARRRAKDGVQEPVYYKGEVVGHIQKYSDTLLIFLLKANRPEKYREHFDVRHGGSIDVTVKEVMVTSREDAAAALQILQREKTG